MRSLLHTTRLFLVGLILTGTWQAQVLAQKESVNPGINKSFENPDVEQFTDRFERDGRDAYDHRKEILAELQLKPGMAIADVGAGTGLFTRLFAEQVGESGRVFAVDIAQNFIDHILKSSKDAGLKNVVGVVCQPDDAKLPPKSVDLVFICDTYHHFEFPQKTMSSIHAALKDEGQVILIDFERIEGKSSEWTMGHVRAGKEVFVNEIRSVGFQPIDEKPEMLRESYFIRFRKVGAGAEVQKEESQSIKAPK